MLRKILIGLVILLVLIQLVRPEKNESKNFTEDITTAYSVPSNVQLILQRSCYDCHSNYTSYPWYSNIQPIAGWLQHHVDEGKEHLNFSEFATYDYKKQAHKLEETAEMVESGEMPMKSYLWMHGGARLSEEDKKTLVNWSRILRAQILESKNLSLNN